jgi:hypothetical protein
MKKLLTVLSDKKFWTLVAAIVGALSVYFCTSCTGYQRLTRSGVHLDTVQVEQLVKSKSYVP